MGCRRGTLQVSWFDPRSGVTVDGGKLETRGRRKLGPAPGDGDVVAVLRR
jgi:hypothetical protein